MWYFSGLLNVRSLTVRVRSYYLGLCVRLVVLAQTPAVQGGLHTLGCGPE